MQFHLKLGQGSFICKKTRNTHKQMKRNRFGGDEFLGEAGGGDRFHDVLVTFANQCENKSHKDHIGTDTVRMAKYRFCFVFKAPLMLATAINHKQCIAIGQERDWIMKSKLSKKEK
jgi:hypothetical protein